MKRRTGLLLLLVTICCFQLSAQETPRYWEDVQVIKKYDKMYAAPQNPILFTGSSSIRKWDDLERTFAGYVAMNRGVGGTIVNDIIFYAEDLIFNYKPRQVVLYVGENDLPDTTSTADSVLHRTQRLVNLIRSKLPDIPLVYISMKPSPSRIQYLQKAIDANALIHKYLSTEKNAVFVDVFTLMLDKEGKPRPELFVSDMLHMNADGYKIWRAAVEPHLVKQ